MRTRSKPYSKYGVEYRESVTTKCAERVRPTGLLDNVWDKRHESGALDSKRQIALLLGRETVFLRRIDLSLRVQEAAQEIGVFVIDVLELLGRSGVLGIYCHNKILMIKPCLCERSAAVPILSLGIASLCSQ